MRKVSEQRGHPTELMVSQFRKEVFRFELRRERSEPHYDWNSPKYRVRNDCNNGSTVNGLPVAISISSVPR